MKNQFFIGLDLGQTQDNTALAIIEQTEMPVTENPEERLRQYAVRHLQRWTLGTGYPRILADVAALFRKAALPRAKFIIDNTGVGRAIVDMFLKAKLPAHIVSVTIAGGDKAHVDKGIWYVPKKEMVGAVQMLLQTHRLRIAEGLPEAGTLTRELLAFRVKVPAASTDTFEAWRARPR